MVKHPHRLWFLNQRLSSPIHFEFWENHGQCPLGTCFWTCKAEEVDGEEPSWFCQGWVPPEQPDCPWCYRTGWMDEGWAAGGVHCDFSRACGAFSCCVLVCKSGCHKLGHHHGWGCSTCSWRVRLRGWGSFSLEIRFGEHLTAAPGAHGVTQKTNPSLARRHLVGRWKSTGVNGNKRRSEWI